MLGLVQARIHTTQPPTSPKRVMCHPDRGHPKPRSREQSTPPLAIPASLYSGRRRIVVARRVFSIAPRSGSGLGPDEGSSRVPGCRCPGCVFCFWPETTVPFRAGVWCGRSPDTGCAHTCSALCAGGGFRGPTRCWLLASLAPFFLGYGWVPPGFGSDQTIKRGAACDRCSGRAGVASGCGLDRSGRALLGDARKRMPCQATTRVS